MNRLAAPVSQVRFDDSYLFGKSLKTPLWVCSQMILPEKKV